MVNLMAKCLLAICLSGLLATSTVRGININYLDSRYDDDDSYDDNYEQESQGRNKFGEQGYHFGDPLPVGYQWHKVPLPQRNTPKDGVAIHAETNQTVLRVFGAFNRALRYDDRWEMDHIASRFSSCDHSSAIYQTNDGYTNKYTTFVIVVRDQGAWPSAEETIQGLDRLMMTWEIDGSWRAFLSYHLPLAVSFGCSARPQCYDYHYLPYHGGPPDAHAFACAFHVPNLDPNPVPPPPPPPPPTTTTATTTISASPLIKPGPFPLYFIDMFLRIIRGQFKHFPGFTVQWSPNLARLAGSRFGCAHVRPDKLPYHYNFDDEINDAEAQLSYKRKHLQGIIKMRKNTEIIAVVMERIMNDIAARDLAISIKPTEPMEIGCSVQPYCRYPMPGGMYHVYTVVSCLVWNVID